MLALFGVHTKKSNRINRNDPKKATKLIKFCKSLFYKERLIHLKLTTLKFRRLRGHMIEVYKILNGYYDDSIVPQLFHYLSTRIQDNSLKLLLIRPKLELRKDSFLCM